MPYFGREGEGLPECFVDLWLCASVSSKKQNHLQQVATEQSEKALPAGSLFHFLACLLGAYYLLSSVGENEMVVVAVAVVVLWQSSARDPATSPSLPRVFLELALGHFRLVIGEAVNTDVGPA